MMDTLQIGVSGMRSAETDATARALNIANVNTKGYVPVEPATNGAGGSGIGAGFRQETLAPQTGTALADIAGNGVNLADELVNLKLAETAYKASAKVVETANEMSDTLLKALG